MIGASPPEAAMNTLSRLDWRRSLEALALAALGLALAAFCELWLFDRWHEWTQFILDGTADRPFVYRQLWPQVVGLAARVAGVSVETAALWSLRLSCVAWLWALRYLASVVLPRGASFIATLMAPILLLPFIVGVVGLYVYDLPSLAAFTLGLALLARHRWGLYLALVPLAVLGRETTALLMVVFALYALPHLGPRRFILALAYQAGTVAVLKLLLAARYAANPGAMFELHWNTHLAFMRAEPEFALIGGAVVIAVVGLALWRYRTLPPFVQAAAVMIPVSFVNYFAFVWTAELRALMELTPLFVLLAALLAQQLAGRLAPERRRSRRADGKALPQAAR
jgi:hypothetical protein